MWLLASNKHHSMSDGLPQKLSFSAFKTHGGAFFVISVLFAFLTSYMSCFTMATRAHILTFTYKYVCSHCYKYSSPISLTIFNTIFGSEYPRLQRVLHSQSYFFSENCSKGTFHHHIILATTTWTTTIVDVAVFAIYHSHSKETVVSYLSQ